MRFLSACCLLLLTGLPMGCTPGLPGPAPAVPAAKPLIPVLCLYSEDLKVQGLNSIDPKALAFYQAKGFDLHTGCYQTTDAGTLARYPVVIGMMPMLNAGTRAIGEKFGADLEAYIRAGGSFVLIPAPSYYGGEDFVRQLNPWLKPFGAELLNEQPRDPLNQRLITRVIGYRYLATTNFVPHEITAGLQRLWLPLDYTDSYILTHTMRLTADWQVVVRGNPGCATYPLRELSAGRKTPGTYGSSPPFLAVRPWGMGRMALFTTSSQYFVFDAYHWAFGDGFVMKEGGERLMVNLLSWLAGPAAARAPARGPVALSAAAVQGNVTFFNTKSDWFRAVQDHFCPSGFRPAAYVDCGAVSDLPYSPERRFGWTGPRSWPVRWSWAEVFHPTAANARAFRATPASYRFDGLNPAQSYQIGLLRWAYQPEAARPIQVKAGALVLADSLPMPRFADQQGPAFSLLTIPASALTPQGRLDLTFSMAAGMEGDFSSLGEIWLFESAAGESHPAFERLLAAQEAPQDLRHEPSSRLQPFRGLIGARSSFSGGVASVAELGRAARTAGYDFLVFTEDARRLDAGLLGALKKACAEASDGTFRCLPGLGFSAKGAHAARPDAPATWGGVQGYVVQEVATLPPNEDYDDPYNLFWSFLGGTRSDGKSVVPTLRSPLSNAISPFYQRFWRGFDVFTLSDSGTVSGDARGLYADLVSSGYGPYPRISGAFQTPESIARAASNAWAVTIFANSLAQLEPYHYTSCVGNGPRFRDYHYTFDYSTQGAAGEGLLFRENAWIVLHADVEAPSAIERVTLYSGQTPLRVWYPKQVRVQITEPIRVARNHELWMEVRCADGTQALTGRYRAEDRLFMMAMCGDNQNTICSLANSPRAFVWEERDLFLSHSYWHTGEAAGQLGAMRRMSDLVPRVIETGIVQPVKLFNPCPKLFLADGSVEDHINAELRILGASSDYNQVEYRFNTPASRARSRVLITSFRPAPSGDTVMLIETELEAKTNLVFKTNGPGLRHLNLAPLRDLAPAWNYTYRTAAGMLVTKAFDYASPRWSLTDKLAAGSGVMVWPSDVGSLLILPLDGITYDLDLRFLPSGAGREQVQLLTHPERLEGGQKVTSRLLIVLHQGTVTSGAALDTLRAASVDVAGCVRALTNGRVMETAYALTVDASENGMTARLDTSGRTEPLPVILRGVTPLWPCGLVQAGTLRLLEAADNTLHFTVSAGQKAVDCFAGNLVRSDRSDLRIEWAGVQDGQVILHLHNPTPQAMTARIWTPPALGLGLFLDASCVVPPGASIWVRGSGKTLVLQNE